MHKPIHSAAIAIAIAISRSLLLPVIFLLTLPLFFGDVGIFIAIPVTDLLTFFLAGFLYLRNKPDTLLAAEKSYRQTASTAILYNWLNPRTYQMAFQGIM
ncbi:MAG: hypothetical protein ACRBB3_09630 [Alphaproteobacteria bacterium]